MKYIIAIPLVVVMLMFSIPTSATAQEAEGGTFVQNPIKADNLLDVVELVLDNIISPIVTVVAVIFLMYSGFLFVTSQGNETKLSQAKSILLWTMVGLFVLISSRVIADIIQDTFASLESA